MGEVWSARDTRLDRIVAIKICKARFSQRFHREARAIAALNHPHICTLYDVGPNYLVMEYVEGGNMRELFNKEDPILVDRVWDILLDMARALEHVHDSGFMHLDYKPENILITRNGQVRLIDFDLAMKRPDKPKKLWKYAGTPAYMAPEQLRHKEVDHRADIFAYGVAAYELLTRRRPFVGDTSEQVVQRQLDRAHGFISPRQHNPDLSVGMEKVIVKCLEPNPDERYPFMSVLIRDLQAAP